MSTPLSARDRSRLKARAHALEPIIHIGHAGLTGAVVAEIDRALTAHELIKIRAGGHERDERAELFEAVSARTGAAIVQEVGKIAVLWRERPDAAGDDEDR
jgi:putative YhbY family RNA-binding protein